jgi:ankyrin repeat protein
MKLLAANFVFVVLALFSVAHADYNQQYTPLYEAAERGDVSAVKELIAAGADVSDATSGLITHCDIIYGCNGVLLGGDTALFGAARSLNPEVVRVLVQAGSDINHQNTEGLTPLMEAVASFMNEDICTYAAKLEVVRTLLQSGAKRNIKAYPPIKETALDFMKDPLVQDSSRQPFIDLLEGKQVAPLVQPAHCTSALR